MTVESRRARHVKTFLSSLYSFIKRDGARFLPQPLIDQRFEICKSCDFFDPKKKMCKICGCGCDSGESIFNKLALPHESCPHHPPKFKSIAAEDIKDLISKLEGK